MYKTFNCGIGMVLVVGAESVELLCASLDNKNERVYEIGRVVNVAAGEERVVFV
jgi:phosphoribosylformylglycinamidine cyclo-ligase